MSHITIKLSGFINEEYKYNIDKINRLVMEISIKYPSINSGGCGVFAEDIKG